MSEVDTPDSSVVHLKGVGLHPTRTVIFYFVMLVVAIGHLVYGILGDHWTLPADEKRFFRAGLGILVFSWLTIEHLMTWRNSVLDASLAGNDLTVSTRAGQKVIPLTSVFECEIFVAKASRRILITLGVVTPRGTEWVKVYMKRNIDPIGDLQLLPALQRLGIRLIGVEVFKRELEHITERSAEGLFDDSRMLQAGGSA